MSRTEVLIVGAGPVGLTLAAELARRGVQSRVIDQSVGPSTTSKAIAIQPRTLEIFRQMGIIDELFARGFMVGAGNFYLNGRPQTRVEFRELETPYGFILDLPQNETEEVLLEHLARNGIKVERECRLLSLRQNDDGVSVDVARPTGSDSIRCEYVVGCDGAHSTVRHVLGLKFVGSPEPEVVILADVALDWLYPHELHMFMHSDGFLVCYPLPGGRYRLIAEITSQENAASQEDAGLDRPPKATPERFREILRRRADPDSNLSDVTWLAGFRIQHQVVEEYGQGRIFLAGDAAHVPSPAGGQGMNTGIQDAFNLAWKIQLVLHGHASDALLASYSAERAPVGRDVVELSNRLRHTNLQDVSTLVKQILEIGICYRDSPIVGQDWRGNGGPEPGGRAPVVDALDGTAHHLLLFTGDEPDLAALPEVQAVVLKDIVCPWLVTPQPREWSGQVLVDPDRSIHRKFGATSPCAYLIRPDGYIGYRASPISPDRISAYLTTVFR